MRSLPLALLLAAPGPSDRSLQGTYVLQPQLGDSVPTKVEATIAEMNPLLRPFARRRLVHTNRPAQTLKVRLSSGRHEIRFDARAPILTPGEGRSIPWVREDGESFQVSTAMEGTALIQRFEAHDGRKTLRYELDTDGRLRLEVTVESRRLPRTLAYTLVYRREAP